VGPNTLPAEPGTRWGRPASGLEVVYTLVAMDLEEIEAIRQLKYRYFRLLDTKRFTELGALLTDDATTSYQSGELSYQGREAIVAFLEESLGNADIVTMHNGHHPEITLTGPTTATGVWYLEDRVVVRAMDFEIVGTLLYDDRYVKVGDTWLIEHTGYERIFEEHRQHSTQQLHSFRAMFDPK
jgi:SnoaL-like domain